MPAFRLADELKQGLRPSSVAGRNTPGLVQCLNAKPYKTGLVGLTLPTHTAGLTTELAAESITVEWPWPQMMQTRNGVFFGVSDELYSSTYTAGTDTWELTALTSGTAVEGDLWHVADFSDYTVFYNGACTVLLNPSGVATVDSDFVPNTGCNFRGRHIQANFISTAGWKTAWKAIWSSALAEAGLSGSADTLAASLTENHVWWSSIGGGDNLMFHKLTTEMLSGPFSASGLSTLTEDGYDTTRRYIQDVIERVEQGSRAMPWEGVVYKVLPLHSGVMVYGSAGVAYLYPMADPHPQFGLLHISVNGVAGRCAANGNLDQHVWVDNTGHLWTVTAGSPPKAMELGYEEFLQPLVAEGPVVEFDSVNRDFYLTGDDGSQIQTFTFTESGGLAEIGTPVLGMANIGGTSYGVLDTAIDTSYTLETGVVDLGSRSIKTIQSFQAALTMDDTTAVTLMVYYRYDKGGSWRHVDPLTLDSEGMAKLKVSGVEFRFILDCSNYTKIDKLDYLEVVLQDGGKRHLYPLITGAKL